MVDSVLHLRQYTEGDGIELREIIYLQLSSAVLVRFPAVEFVGRVQVGEAYLGVKLLHVRGIDAGYREPSCAYTLLVDEVGEDTLSGF